MTRTQQYGQVERWTDRETYRQKYKQRKRDKYASKDHGNMMDRWMDKLREKRILDRERKRDTQKLFYQNIKTE